MRKLSLLLVTYNQSHCSQIVSLCYSRCLKSVGQNADFGLMYQKKWFERSANRSKVIQDRSLSWRHILTLDNPFHQQQEGKHQIRHGSSQEELVGIEREANNPITAEQPVYRVKPPRTAFRHTQKASSSGRHIN